MPAPKGNKYAEGNNGGRPRIHEVEDLPALGQQMLDFFEERLEKLGEEKTIHFLSDFAKTIGVSRSTINKYSEENEEFMKALKQVSEIQRDLLIKGGLTGIFNPTAFIFTAKNIAGMRDKTETEHTGNLKISFDDSFNTK